jgi:hypothetical protein
MTFREALDLAKEQQTPMHWEDLLVLRASIFTFCIVLLIILVE